MAALLLASAAAIESGVSREHQAAFGKALRSSLRSRSIGQCQASAPNAAAAMIDVLPLGACVTDRLFATKSVEKLEV